MKRAVSWVIGFGRFWYHFIVGDDWTVALAVAAALVATAVLNRRGVNAWWVVPLVVVVVVTVSVNRFARRTQRPPG
jgi:membrane protein implicated in regulation of membrane protease activity